MYGGSIGTLQVFAGDRTSTLTSVWVEIGEHPDNPELWKTATMYIPQYSDPVVSSLILIYKSIQCTLYNEAESI